MAAVDLPQWGVPNGVYKNDAHQPPQFAATEQRILLVEDIVREAELTTHELHRSGISFGWRRVQTEVGLRRALREYRPTLILSDFTLPQFDGLKALRLARELAPQTPFIFVSGSIGEERAIDAVQKGAADYVLKRNLSRLAPAVKRALSIATTAAANLEPTPPKAALIDRNALECQALEYRLRRAVALQQFELNYQPKVCVRTRRIVGVEALLRWRDPDVGLVSPASFLPTLESSGLILEVGEWILERAARDSRHWRRLGLPHVRTAVNISPIQLRRADFAHRFLQLTRAWASGVFSLDIEINGNALLGDAAANIKKLKLLRTAGIRVAIDDFGSGLCPLGGLSDLPIDSLKIDKVFIGGLPEGRTNKAVVSNAISLARGLRLSVVAEGVETREQLETLRQMGCDQSQGYLHSRPVSRDEFAALLQRGDGWLMLPAEASGTDERVTHVHSIRVNAI